MRWCLAFAMLVSFMVSSTVVAGDAQDCLRFYYMKAYQQAVPICQSSAETGHAQVQFVLAKMLLEGKGVKKDSQQAMGWLQEAARQGHVPARHKLQNIDAHDLEVERRRSASKLWAKHRQGPSTEKPELKASKQVSGVEIFAEPRPVESVRVKPAPVKIKRAQFLRTEIIQQDMQAKRVGVKAVREQVSQENESDTQYEGLNSSETAEIGRTLAMDMAEDLQQDEAADELQSR